MTSIINIDKTKCIKCGICADVCPSCILTMGEDGPECLSETSCMSCGHCVAICPKGAFNNSRCPLDEQETITMPTLDKKTAYNFLRTRRSIRNFKNELVSEDKLRELLEIARYAPSAGNSQGLYYIVVSDKELIKKITRATVDWMREQIDAHDIRRRYFMKTLAVYDKGSDIIARNANQLVFALSRRMNTTGNSNCEQAWAYVALYAPTIGLGTTIMGFIQSCAQADYQPLLDLLAVPNKQKIVGTLMVGYPKYKYYRMVDRQHLKVDFR